LESFSPSFGLDPWLLYNKLNCFKTDLTEIRMLADFSLESFKESC
jgi:hypothetical protein